MSTLKREVGLAGAIIMGLGSIVGTGVFVSIGIGASIAGDALGASLLLAALLAACNGLSSAQLATAYPVSGGTYEYANRTLGPTAGFTAGWMYLTAKSASAATAALGFSGYLLRFTGQDAGHLLVPIALAVVFLTTVIVLAGARRTNIINTIAVSVTFAVLGTLVVMGLPSVGQNPPSLGLWDAAPANVMEATALMFVAYTGYGRIATLGEEVTRPRHTIPRAIVATLAIVCLLYTAVAAVGLSVLGAADFGTAALKSAAPLEHVAQTMAIPWLPPLVTIGAASAMFGVLLNLILGLSRVLMAMGRRKDMPSALARVNQQGTTPTAAVLTMGLVIGSLVTLGSVKTTWSFSALTVLVYYGFTNASALLLAPEQRLYPPIISWLGLGGCAFLAVWVQPRYWVAGAGILALGYLVRGWVHRAS